MTQNFEANWLLINVIDIDAIDYTSITYQAALPINYSLIRHIPGVLNWWQLIIVDINIYYAAYLLCKEYLNNFQDEITLMGELSRSGSTSAHYWSHEVDVFRCHCYRLSKVCSVTDTLKKLFLFVFFPHDLEWFV